MSEEEKDKSPAGSSEGASDAGVSATDTEGKIVKIEQFLDVFEVRKVDGGYEMNVDSYLRDRLKSKDITHEEYVKKIKDAQKFISDCYAEKDGEKKMWGGTASGGETPTLKPSSDSDMEIAEFLFLMQTHNCYENIARAFDVEKDEEGKPFFKSREDISEDSLAKGVYSLLKLGWRSDGFDTDRVTDESGIEHFTVTCNPSTDIDNPSTDIEKKLVNSDFFTPQSTVLRAFDIEKDEEGKLSLKSKEGAIEEDIVIAKAALEKLGWIEDFREERIKDASGKEYYSVTSVPPLLPEDEGILGALLLYKEEAVISGKGGKEGTITGSDEVGDLGGVGEADKSKKGKMRVGTGYGEGSDLFVDRVSEAKKLLSELETPNSETMADFFVDLCVKTTEKIKNDLLLIYQRTLDAVIREKSEIAKTLREFAFGDKDKNGAIDMLAEQIQKGDTDSAKGTINRLTTIVGLTLKSDVDKNLADRSLKEIGKALKDNKEALDSGKIDGNTLIKQLAPAFADLKIAISNKRRFMRSQPTAGHGARTT